MARVRNDFGEDRTVSVAPFFYQACPAGHVFEVPDADALHWAAGGWTVLDPYPVPAHLIGNHPDGLAFPMPQDPIDRSETRSTDRPYDQSIDSTVDQSIGSSTPMPPAVIVPPAPEPAEPGEPSA